MQEKKLGLPSVVATGVGLIVATSCLLSLGQGSSMIGTPFIITMVIACAFNILTAFSICELNALMPNLTGGMAQYTLACFGPYISIVVMVGGYLTCMTVVGSSESAMFGNTLSSVFTGLNIPGSVYSIGLIAILMILNLFGVDMFAKVQNIVAYGLIISLVVMGILGCIKVGTGEVVTQPTALSTNFGDICSLLGLAFYLFIGVEFVVPIAPQVRNARRNLPLGMVISLIAILVMQIFMVIGFSHYTPWAELGESTVPHILYGSMLLGKAGVVWMTIVSLLAVISSIKTVLYSLAQICSGMSKIGLLPSFFMKTNKHGTPYFGLLLIGAAMILINATGLSNSDQLSFLILTGSVFWIFAYIILHCDVLVLRKRLPDAPRTFKLPLGPVIPIIGIIGNAFMIYNIDSSWDVKLGIYKVCLIVLAILTVYAVVWTKYVIKRPLFKTYQIKEVVAMENELYQVYHHPKVARRLHLHLEPVNASVRADTNTGTRPEN